METKETNGSTTTIITDTAGMPNNKNAERAVLSQCFHSAEHLQRILDAGITRLDFHNTDHKVVFEAIQRLHQDGDIVDGVTVCDRLLQDRKLKEGEVGLPVLVADLVSDSSPNSPNTHIEILKRETRKRLLLSTMQMCETRIEQMDGDLTGVFSQIRDTLDMIEFGAETPYFDFADVKPEYPPMILRANTQDGAGAVLSEGTVCMLAGAGGISKSSLALWISLGVAGIEIGKTDAICNGLFVAQGGPVLFVSEEDKAGATSARLRAMARYAEREDAIKNLHGVSIEGVPMFGSEDIRQRPQRLEGWPRVWGSARKVGAKLVVIDPALGAYANSQNEETGIREFLGLVSREAERIGAGVLMVAHSRKSAREGKENPFDPGQVGGSTHWTDRARGVMTLTRDSKRRRLVLAISKANYGIDRVQAEIEPFRASNGDLETYKKISGWRSGTGQQGATNGENRDSDFISRRS